MPLKRRSKSNINYLSTFDVLENKYKDIKLKEGQEEILQSYDEYQSIRDVSLELPTGYGKTLIGGIIAEYNRLRFNYKVVYCCATRHLAHQTKMILERHGIDSIQMTGNSSSFNHSDKMDYQRKKKVVITTYSHIFNTHPYFNDADLLIFDDAHAAEYAINSMWNLQINKEKSPEIFSQLYSLLNDYIPDNRKYHIDNNTTDYFYNQFDMLPQYLWFDEKETIIETLNQYIKEGSNEHYQWIKMRNILHCSNIFIDNNNFEIIPFSPPNLLNEAFENVKQRVYMSATLGVNSRLEKLFGIENIKKLELSETFDLPGKRLILFPEINFNGEDLTNAVRNTIDLHKKALILSPSKKNADTFIEYMNIHMPEYDIFMRDEIETNMTAFNDSEKAILIVSGRFEGIDLNADICELIIFYNLPLAINAQENFMHNKLQAADIVYEHLNARIVQGVGRTSRSEKDRSTVLFLGSNYERYLFNSDFTRTFPRRIAAEIEFGEDQDEIESLGEWESIIKNFKEQNSEWNDYEEDINERYEDFKSNISNDQQDEISEIVQKEIRCMYKMTENNLIEAYEISIEIIGALAGKQKYRGHRAWWNYIASCLSYQLGYKNRMLEFTKASLNASINKTWMNPGHINRFFEEEEVSYNVSQEKQVVNIIDNIKKQGLKEQKFIKYWKKLMEDIENKNAKIFEPALKRLGDALGVFSRHPKEVSGSPDGFWSLGDTTLVFEAKTNYSSEKDSIPLSHLNQAQSHKNWIIDHYNVNPNDEILRCFISDVTSVKEDDLHSGKDIYLITHQEVIDMAKVLNQIHMAVYRNTRNHDELTARDELINLLNKHSLFFSNIKEKILKREIKRN